jgi:putative transposase
MVSTPSANAVSVAIGALVKPDVCAEIKAKIKEIFQLHKGRYGYRCIALALRNLGMLINRKKCSD